MVQNYDVCIRVQVRGTNRWSFAVWSMCGASQVEVLSKAQELAMEKTKESDALSFHPYAVGLLGDFDHLLDDECPF